MNELLQKLLETEILTAETKKELEEAFAAKQLEAINETKMETEGVVRAELATKWVSEKEALVEAMDTMITSLVSEEIADLKEDIKDFRDLEAEYASRLIKVRAEMREELKEDLKTLIDSLDTFLEMQLKHEMNELKEDLAEARKLDFGRRVFEGFVKEYNANHVDKVGIEKEFIETKAVLEQTEAALKDVRKDYDSVIRSLKLESLLKNLDGRTREVMETVLLNVPTEKLDRGFEKFIGRVLKESTSSEKETEVLAEGTKVPEKKVEKKKTLFIETGDSPIGLPAASKTKLSESAELNIWKRLAGMESK